ncbi:hypothetical protein CSOJ01_13994 [Colletotrichum sojae]|uniref:Uncharacterized protein n=1 Tax=Colletotrichum sojae TaxID=2175907 RepID=A0A8H6IR09_9PEZI|nr:hypothetical protein CSOJ01_13994 [Colletotrichum sojae]
MRSTYNDPQRLVSSLNDMYGEGNYHLKTISNRFIIMLPAPMKPVRNTLYANSSTAANPLLTPRAI